MRHDDAYNASAMAPSPQPSIARQMKNVNTADAAEETTILEDQNPPRMKQFRLCIVNRKQYSLSVRSKKVVQNKK